MWLHEVVDSARHADSNRSPNDLKPFEGGCARGPSLRPVETADRVEGFEPLYVSTYRLSAVRRIPRSIQPSLSRANSPRFPFRHHAGASRCAVTCHRILRADEHIRSLKMRSDSGARERMGIG